MAHSLSPLSRDGLYLEGPAGTGKTAAAARHLAEHLDGGTPAAEILVLLPQRALADPYYEAARNRPGGRLDVYTISGLARAAIERFWPLVAEDAGFDPGSPPTFLTLETAQYFMAQVARPLMEEGAFAGLSILESRLYSQLLDNLNKASVVGFDPSDISKRLKAAWAGDAEYLAIYDDVQRAVDKYLALCCKHNLLDFSLQLRTFYEHLWNEPTCREHLESTYRHVIADNVEEGVPATHDLLAEWLPSLETAFVVFDDQAGHRQFMGADPSSAKRLKSCCKHHRAFPDDSEDDNRPPVVHLGVSLAGCLSRKRQEERAASVGTVRRHVDIVYARSHPEMLSVVADRIQTLIACGTAPREIAVLAPFMPDTLRYAFGEALSERKVPYFSRRPSRPLSKEPAIKTLLALTALAHPAWRFQLDARDVAQALTFSISDLDPVRAHLLAQEVYQLDRGKPGLGPFNAVRPDVQERVTYRIGRRYSRLQKWMAEYVRGEKQPVDHFLSRLFGEVLSQDGCGFHDDFDAAAQADSLVKSARHFRQVIEHAHLCQEKAVGRLYLKMVRSGLAAAQYLPGREARGEEVVLLAPAHTFLMQNRRTRHQFWLDAGSTAWHNRIRQPLTHPHVLTRSWEEGEKWTAADEHEAGTRLLGRLVTGLSRQCSDTVHLAISARGQSGQKQQGYLLRAFQQLFSRDELSTPQR